MAKVLLVEDDNNLREIYEARLAAEGYEISSAQDGEEALVVAKQAKPDLVISDVMMPKISGFEMLDILRNTPGLESVKVIMLTALGQTEDRDRADNLGADKYLVKSQVTLEDIVKTAHELLGESPAPAATEQTADSAPVATAPAVVTTEMPVVAPEPTPEAVAVEPAPSEAASTPEVAAPSVVPDDQSSASTATTADDQTLPDQSDSSVPSTPAPVVEPAQSDTATPAVPLDNQQVDPVDTEEETVVNDQITNFLDTIPADTPAVTDPESTATAAPPTAPDDEQLAPTVEAPTPAAAPEPTPEAVAVEPAPSETPAPEETTSSEPAVVTPEAPTATETLAAGVAAEASDDQLMADAIKELSAAAPEPTPEAVAVEPAPSETPAPEETTSSEPAVVTPEAPTTEPTAEDENSGVQANISISGKKVIQPLSSEPKPSINDLLAKEEAMQAAAGTAGLASGPAVIASSDTDEQAALDALKSAAGQSSPAIIQQPGKAFAPQPVTEPVVSEAPVDIDQPSGAPAPAPSEQSDTFDPNSVAL